MKTMNKTTIHIGDKVFEASLAYGKVFEWEITDIYIENYLSGYETIFTVKRKADDINIVEEKFDADIFYMFETKEEAERVVAKWRADNG